MNVLAPYPLWETASSVMLFLTSSGITPEGISCKICRTNGPERFSYGATGPRLTMAISRASSRQRGVAWIVGNTSWGSSTRLHIDRCS